MEIDGKTKIMAVIGSPIVHSLSPFIHNYIAGQLGHNIAYAAFDVISDDFDEAIKGARPLGIIGLNITAPYKARAANIATFLDDLAQQAGAVNLLKLTKNGYAGYNTDIYGIRKAFEHFGITIAGKSIRIIGAGSTGRSAAIAMAQMGVKSICIANRSREKAEALANILAIHYNVDIRVCNYEFNSQYPAEDIAILATTPDYIPSHLDHFATIFDVNYYPLGRVPRAIGGLEMLIYQAVQTYEIILGTEVPVKIIDEILAKIKGRLLC